MRVKVPLPAYWPVIEQGPPLVVEVLPEVTLTLGELEPLPPDLRAWGDRIVFAGHPVENVRVGQVQDTKTETGWPVTMFGSDVIDPRTKRAVERRLHAEYRFDKYGGSVILRSATIHLFDTVVDEVIAALLKAGPDWDAGEVICIADLWRGLTLVSKGSQAGAQSAPPDPTPPPSSY